MSQLSVFLPVMLGIPSSFQIDLFRIFLTGSPTIWTFYTTLSACSCHNACQEPVRCTSVSEDKALSWLIDGLKLSVTSKSSLYFVSGTTILLAIVCRSSKRVDLPVNLSLPTCQIVDSVIDIRDFWLCTKFPSFQQNSNAWTKCDD